MELGSLFLAAALCSGRVTDKAPHPLVILPKPAPGETFYDQSFGTYITRITAADPKEGPNAVIVPAYGTMPAWNADESLLLLWHREKGHELYQGEAPYTFIRSIAFFHPTDIEQILWDPSDPNTAYYPTNYNALPYLIKHTFSPADEDRVIHDFSTAPTNCPRGDWGKLLSFGSDPQWMGLGPRKLVGLQCKTTKFIYSIAEDKVISTFADSSPDAPIVGPSEARVWYEGYSIEVSSLRITAKFAMANPGEHASMGASAAGDVWNAVAFDGSPIGSIVSYSMATTKPKVIVGPDTGWPAPPSGTHLSAIAQKAPGWVAASIIGSAHDGQEVLDNEILLANVDDGTVCRVAHNRTWAGTNCGARGDQCPWGYWGEPHVVISPSGTRLLFASDWQGSSSVDTYVVDLRKPRKRVSCSQACDVTSEVPGLIGDCLTPICEEVK